MTVVESKVKSTIKDLLPPGIVLPSYRKLIVLQPDRKWRLRPDGAHWKEHGHGHNARLVILYSLEKSLLEKNKTVVFTPIEDAATLFALITHDLRYKRDFEAVYHPNSHQQEAANTEWLSGIYDELSVQAPDQFPKSLGEPVVTLTSLINRIHDFTRENKALKTVNKEQGLALEELPQVVGIFREFDRTFERLRLVDFVHERVPAFLQRIFFAFGPVRQSVYPVEHPIFEESKDLFPVAKQLYYLTTRNPNYLADQWQTVFSTALENGILVA